MQKRFAIAANLLLWYSIPPTLAAATEPPKRPRLVVLVSIDQCRTDYLTRFEDLFLPAVSGGRVGGFRYMMERGANYVDARHEHIPTATGPGHAVLMTGAPPSVTGIIGNEWYDRNLKTTAYCVQDDAKGYVPQYPNPASLTVKGISAARLQVTTVGDELKMATGGKAKVFGIGLKDRAAVLMAGHLADGAYWFNDSSGAWETSAYYRKDGTLPHWMAALNQDRERNPASYLGKEWLLSDNITAAALERLWVPPGKDRSTYPATYANAIGADAKFPHRLSASPSGARPFQAFTVTPFANDFVLHSALKIVEAEGLGLDQTPDVLAINLSTNDYIGHTFGPDSAEVMDVTVKTDRQLSAFFNEIGRRVPGGLSSVLMIVTADHGCPPNPILMRDSGISGGNWLEAEIVATAEKALDLAFPPQPGDHARWIATYTQPYLWLDHDVAERRRVPLDQARRIAANAVSRSKGIYTVYTADQLLNGELPQTQIGRYAAQSYYPNLSGDIMVVSRPFWYQRSTEKGVTHAEPYAYDSQVPLLLAGFGIRHGTCVEPVSTLDIAPTVSFLLRVAPPSGSQGRILSGAVKSDSVGRR